MLVACCPRPGCVGSMLADLWGQRVCSLCAYEDKPSDPLPLVSELLLAVDPPDSASRAAALAGRELSVEEEQRARTRSLNAASAMRYRDRLRAAKENGSC